MNTLKNAETAVQWIAQALEDYAASLPPAARAATQAVGRQAVSLVVAAIKPAAPAPAEPVPANQEQTDAPADC